MKFIVVKSFDSYVTANIWLGKLTDVGIRCYLKDEYTVTIDPILSNAIGGIKLCVAEPQVKECNELIAAFEHQGQQRQQCPACHSLDVQYITQPGTKSWLTAIITWMFGCYAVSTKQVYHCFTCGNEFEELNNDELNSIAAK